MVSSDTWALARHIPCVHRPAVVTDFSVYWIGGGSGAGKSTIARRLAAEHGLKHYATDDVMGDHVKRSDPRSVRFCISSCRLTWTRRG